MKLGFRLTRMCRTNFDEPSLMYKNRISGVKSGKAS